MTPRVHAAYVRGHPGSRPDAEASAILDLGFRGIVLGEPFHESRWEGLRTLLPRGSIVAVEVFLPWPRQVSPGSRAPFEIASLHPEERRDAARQAVETVLFAEKNSIPLVLIPPGRMDSPPREASLPREHDPHREERLARLLTERQAESAPRLDALLGCLSKMLAAADRYGVEVALSPGGFLDEIPSSEEAARCLHEFRGAPLRAWLDTASQAAALAMTPAGCDPFEALAGYPPAGATLRDATPGREPVVDWEKARPRLEPCPVWAADPPRGGGAGGLEQARSFLEKLEGLGEPPREQPGGRLGIPF